MSIFGFMALVGTAPAAFAAPPAPDATGPNAPISYGTQSIPLQGTNKITNSAILVNGASCDSSAAFFAIAGNWACTYRFQPIVNSFDFDVSAYDLGTNSESPDTTLHVDVAPSKLALNTPTSAGTTVTATGTYDPTEETSVTAVLRHAGQPDVPADADCDLGANSVFTCTFSNVAVDSGYTVVITQKFADAFASDRTSPKFSTVPVPPNNPNPPHHHKPKPKPDPTTPANPTIAPVIDPIQNSPISPTPTPTPSTTPAAPTPTPTPGTHLNSSKKASHHHKVSDATKRLLQFGIAGIVLMGIGGGRGLARSALGVGPEGEVVFAWRDDGEVKRKVDLTEKIGVGDRSFTWRFPWHRPIDAISLTVPSKLAPRSPFLGRLAADGAEIRAAFGTLWLLLPAAGAVLGVVALADTSGHALPPAYWLVLSITALAIFDALAGAIATLVFFGGILLSGGFWNEAEPDFAHSVLVFLILSLLWTSLPLIGTATRPFRRLGKPSARYAWDRIADLIIASLLCAWIAQKSLEVMDLFAGTETGLEHHADQLAIVVLVMIVVRIVIEHLASIWYPRRLAEVEIDGELPHPTRAANLIGVAVRTAAYSFIGHVFIGTCWQWWLGTALFFLPQVGALVQHRFAAVELLKRLMPKGIVEIFVLIVACTLAVRYAEHHNDSELEAIRYAFLALALPPALIGAVALFGGEGERGKRTWAREILGLVILIATVTLALKGWEY
jgi:hypothetical protein